MKDGRLEVKNPEKGRSFISRYFLNKKGRHHLDNDRLPASVYKGEKRVLTVEVHNIVADPDLVVVVIYIDET